MGVFTCTNLAPFFQKALKKSTPDQKYERGEKLRSWRSATISAKKQ
jgi:hypothetical protein